MGWRGRRGRDEGSGCQLPPEARKSEGEPSPTGFRGLCGPGNALILHLKSPEGETSVSVVLSCRGGSACLQQLREAARSKLYPVHIQGLPTTSLHTPSRAPSSCQEGPPPLSQDGLLTGPSPPRHPGLPASPQFRGS